MANVLVSGTIDGARSGLLDARLPGAAVGDGVRIVSGRGEITGVVTSLRGSHSIIAAHGNVDGIAAGDTAYIDPAALTMPLGTMLLGRSFDARGVALDDGPALRGRAHALPQHAPLPSQRAAITEPFWTGVRAIDALLTIGRGARVGLFGPPGAGKSTLLQLLARGARADAVVVGLVGERGREAEEWIRTALRHASIVCATSDRSPAERVRAARIAMAQAHVLRARGLHVLLIVDSLARFASALREIALASGEPVGRGGYPPSVFADLARYVEVAGRAERGSITLIATVLSDGDERDPVSDAARSLLDGHVQLSVALARAGRYPAIDVPASASRTMTQVVAAGHLHDAQLLRRSLDLLAQTADARALGILPSDAFALTVLAHEAAIARFVEQGPAPEQPAWTLERLHEIADKIR